MEITVEAIAEHINGNVIGNKRLSINGVAKIEEAAANHITFIANPKYLKYLEETQADVIIVNREVTSQKKTLIQVDDPYFGFLQVTLLFHPERPPVKTGIHPTAIIGKHTTIEDNPSIGSYVSIGGNCRIGKNIQILPGVVIGSDVEIADDVRIYSNVTIREGTKIGSRVIIQPGAVIGSDGFGYAKQNGVYHKIPQVGIVVIEDDVEIGANATLDRGTMGETRICKGVKIDNLVQVGHNVVIGTNSVVVAQTGIGGSTKFGENVTIGGQAGFVGHIEIGDNVMIGAQSGVTKPIPSDTVVFGYPARPIRKVKRTEAHLRKLPELFQRVKKLEKEKGKGKGE